MIEKERSITVIGDNSEAILVSVLLGETGTRTISLKFR